MQINNFKLAQVHGVMSPLVLKYKEILQLCYSLSLAQPSASLTSWAGGSYNAESNFASTTRCKDNNDPIDTHDDDYRCHTTPIQIKNDKETLCPEKLNYNSFAIQV